MDGVDRVWHYAARHEVQGPAGMMVVYNVHLPSPRHALVKSENTDKILAQNYWELQGRMVEELCGKIESDSLPAVVVGDWNVPALGPRYRRMTRVLRDGHAEAGVGYGFTAPGDVRHPLAFWCSWLRLDYVMAGKDWKILASDTEPPTDAQHAAVFAEVMLISSSKAVGSR
jgi:endonuclease/exonuclease/phosphatase family metal-dependent hydrolase